MTVTVTSKSTGAVRTVVTDGEGIDAVTNLGPGAYVVAIELAGFGPKSREVVLSVGQIEKVEVELTVATLTEQVNVTADAPVLDLSSAKIGVNVSPEEVQNLPVNGRNFANPMTLATGATSDGNGGWASVRFNGKSNQSAPRRLPPRRRRDGQPVAVAGHEHDGGDAEREHGVAAAGSSTVGLAVVLRALPV